MELYFEGIILAACTFLIIGIFHPMVIKTEYYFGTKPWIIWCVSGIICCVLALFIKDTFWSALLGVTGASLLWGIGEIFEQKKRVEKGWFPMNKRREHEYKRKYDKTIDEK